MRAGRAIKAGGTCRKAAASRHVRTRREGGSATIFRWTNRSPQDLAPRRSKPRGSLHQVAPASSGLSLSRSRWSAQVARGSSECQSLYRHEAMDISAWRSRFRGSNFTSRLVHTQSRSKEHTSELQSIQSNSYADYGLKKKK